MADEEALPRMWFLGYRAGYVDAVNVLQSLAIEAQEDPAEALRLMSLADQVRSRYEQERAAYPS